MRPIIIPPDNDTNLLSSSELAAKLGVAPVTVARWRAEGLPRLRLSTRAFRYDLVQVRAWLSARQVQL